MSDIHSTAIVSSKAELGNNIKVGPYAIIHDDVVIEDDTVIGPHAIIYDGARIGKRVKIFQGCSISNTPQDLKFKDEQSLFYIGNDTVIREFCSFHRGTIDNGFSRVGKNSLFMAYSHVAHDCILGDNVIVANSVQIGGHAEIGDWVIIGGLSPVHQFVKIGPHAMIGGGFRAVVDVPPYVMAAGVPLRFSGINLLGLRRRGFANEDILALKKAYLTIYKMGLNFTQAKEKVTEEFPDHPLVKNVLDFLSNVKRSGFK